MVASIAPRIAHALRRLWAGLREIERLAAPASTLLWVSLAATALLAALLGVAEARPAPGAGAAAAVGRASAGGAAGGAVGQPPWPQAVCHAGRPAHGAVAPSAAWLPPQVLPGDTLPFAIALPPLEAAAVYLPGLDAARVPLAFDRGRRLWHGAVAVPADAPARGYFTLRVVSAAGAEWEVQVPLGAAGPRTLNL